MILSLNFVVSKRKEKNMMGHEDELINPADRKLSSDSDRQASMGVAGAAHTNQDDKAGRTGPAVGL